MMGWFFAIMTVCGLLLGCLAGNGAAMLDGMAAGADSAVKLTLSLSGSYLLWSGLMNVARRAGLIEGLARVMRRPLRVLMPNIGDAAAPVTLNIAANFLGLGNAATPFGLEAMRALNKISPTPEAATDEICMFLALNTTAVELLPTSVIAIRTALGSESAYSVVVPTFLSSVASALAAILVAKAFSRSKR